MILNQEETMNKRKSISSRILTTDLEVAALIERVRRTEQRHLPAEEILIIGELHSEPLHRLLLQTLVLESQGAEGATARLGRPLRHPSTVVCFSDLPHRHT